MLGCQTLPSNTNLDDRDQTKRETIGWICSVVKQTLPSSTNLDDRDQKKRETWMIATKLNEKH